MNATLVFWLLLLIATTGFVLSAQFFLFDRQRGKELAGVLPSQFLEVNRRLRPVSFFLEGMSAVLGRIASWVHIHLLMPFAIYLAIQYEIGSLKIALVIAVAVVTSWVFRVIIDAENSRSIRANQPIQQRNDWFYWSGVALVNIPRVYPLYLLFCLLKP